MNRQSTMLIHTFIGKNRRLDDIRQGAIYWTFLRNGTVVVL